MINNTRFNNLISDGMNPFEAVLTVANDTRRLRRHYKYIPTESETLDWACSGNPPSDLQKRCQQYIIRRTTPMSIIRSELCLIDDVEVKQGVILSMDKTIKNKQIIFDYGKCEDEYKQSRIRILCRILWYTILQNRYNKSVRSSK